MKKFHFILKELLATFWFLPVLILAFSVFLSIGLVYLDSILTISQEGWTRLFLVTSSDSARSILSTISGAMIGVAGTVFSVTLVALTLASSQFGPRLIKNFMYVRLNQVVLGSYISTYLYCLLVLNSVKAADDYTFIPSISILVAIVAAFVNIILLIIFIHQIASSIQADKVISEISVFIAKQVVYLFPEKIGEEKEEEDESELAEMQAGYQMHISIKSPKSGYLQYIASDSLMNIVSRQDAILEIYHRPGGYLAQAKFPSKYRLDEEGKLRIIADAIDDLIKRVKKILG